MHNVIKYNIQKKSLNRKRIYGDLTSFFISHFRYRCTLEDYYPIYRYQPKHYTIIPSTRIHFNNKLTNKYWINLMNIYILTPPNLGTAQYFQNCATEKETLELCRCLNPFGFNPAVLCCCIQRRAQQVALGTFAWSLGGLYCVGIKTYPWGSE